MSRQRILVIRLGALGDLILCCPAFQAIRRAHPDAEIALLTMPAFAAFARQMPWFDTVLTDSRAPAWRLDRWRDLARQVRCFDPQRVYDLQGKRRQSVLYALLGGPFGAEWSGAAPFCKFPRLWPPLPDMHFADFIGAQLAQAGIPAMPPADFAWLAAAPEGVDLARRYALLIPGCGAGREYKRWPASRYAELARGLQTQGIAALVVGTAADRDATKAVCDAAPSAVDLTGQTSLAQLATLARHAVAVIGNDTGPTHLCAAVGAPTLALFSPPVDTGWSAPRGAKVETLQANLQELETEQVRLALTGLMSDNR